MNNNHFLQGIDTVILRVKDINKAKSWYTEKLGFNNIHEDSKLRLVVLDTFSPTSLTIWETDEEIKINPKTTSYPIFRTMDASNAHRQLKKMNVRVGDIITDHVVTYFTFLDLDDNILEVCQVHD
ncbi:MAG TPA: VOC family protein [Cyclobacteriaceae bacterium]|mgnify:CR=1 FL=1|nr:VOC family protein [Cyclobacteriaceae bacterium]